MHTLFRRRHRMRALAIARAHAPRHACVRSRVELADAGMAIFVERFLLPGFVAIVAVCVLQNQMHLTWDQRIAMFLAISASLTEQS